MDGEGHVHSVKVVPRNQVCHGLAVDMLEVQCCRVFIDIVQKILDQLPYLYRLLLIFQHFNQDKLKKLNLLQHGTLVSILWVGLCRLP